MKNTIYKYFYYEFIRYFIVTLFSLAVIVWTVQAVNFLDLVTQDGHAFSIYFLYSFLTLSKVLTKLIPFCFLIATVLTILKLEKDNELIVLWTSGLNKINIVNLFLKISLLIMFLQLTLTIIINPSLLNLSRTLLKNSELQFIPSLLKEKQFNDTVDSLTIFVDKKNNDGTFDNIFILDEGKILQKIDSNPTTIFAKSGYVTDDDKNLVLLNGNIQKVEVDKGVSIVKFEKTALNLSGISAKSIRQPKLQETPTLQIMRCLQVQYFNLDEDKCEKYDKNFSETKVEINKRFGMPIFIPLISLVCCFLLTSRKDKKITAYSRYIYFFIGFLILALAEVSVRYSGVSWNHTAVYYLIPMGISPLFYLLLVRAFKYENLS